MNSTSFSALAIPIRISKPFIVGVYYGNGKPDLNEYFDEIMQELMRLSPVTATNEDSRKCMVELRIVLGDCPMRAWMTGDEQMKIECAKQMI
jgi:hypothetical protein